MEKRQILGVEQEIYKIVEHLIVLESKQVLINDFCLESRLSLLQISLNFLWYAAGTSFLLTARMCPLGALSHPWLYLSKITPSIHHWTPLHPPRRHTHAHKGRRVKSAPPGTTSVSYVQWPVVTAGQGRLREEGHACGTLYLASRHARAGR